MRSRNAVIQVVKAGDGAREAVPDTLAAVGAVCAQAHVEVPAVVEAASS